MHECAIRTQNKIPLNDKKSLTLLTISTLIKTFNY